MASHVSIRTVVVAALAAGCADTEQSPESEVAQAATASVTIAPISWNMVGLDSNAVATGPNEYLIGARIRNTGTTDATSLTATFAFTSTNNLINLQGPATQTIASLAAGQYRDVYFGVAVTRTAAAYNTKRGYTITVSGDGIASASTPAGRELYVEKLVSQQRNETTNITGSTLVNTGDVVTYVLDAKTATSYEQLVAGLTFNSDFFEVLSTSTTYSIPTGATNTTVYADACGWNNAPTSPTYRSCIGPAQYTGGKVGGTVKSTYVVRVVGRGTTKLSGLIYDYSGSSYHYNADHSTYVKNITINGSPTGVDDSYGTTVNTQLVVGAPGVLDNDVDPEAGTLSASLVSGPSNGSLVLSANGGFTYTPAVGFMGVDSFVYRATDATSQSAPTTVTIYVGGNMPPNAHDDVATVAEDAPATFIDVLANDTTEVGETLTIKSVTQPDDGTVVIVTGGVTFQPAPNFHGTTAFTYTIDDGKGATSTASVVVVVLPENDAPEALDDVATVDQDAPATSIDVLANDSSEPDSGETLTVTSITQPQNGAVMLVGGNVRFTPLPGFHGTTTFTYTISDGNGGSATATVTVTVTARTNTPPDANDDSFTVDEDSAAMQLDVLANDTTAPDTGETLAITAVTQPTAGTVTIASDGNSVWYTPPADFHGIESFTYTISDGNGASDTATVTVHVTSVNDAPDAVDDMFTLDEDASATLLDVLANDTTAPDTGETLAITSVSQPAAGTVTIAPDGGAVLYTPPANFHGTTGFTYSISDGNGGGDTASVTIVVRSVNDAPIAIDDAFTVDEDDAATLLDVLANDSTAPDTNETLEITSVTQPASGTVTIAADRGAVWYTPPANFHGTTTFTYTISDGNGGSDSANVSIVIASVNDAPDAVDDAFTLDEDAAPTLLDVLANDTTAPDTNETLAITSITQPGAGTVTIAGNGDAVWYTPPANFHGTTGFTYTISDGNGGSDTASVAISVTSINDPPDAVDDVFAVQGTTVLDVLANDSSDELGETLVVIAVTQPDSGMVTLVDGIVTYVPVQTFEGTTSFSYTISDGNGGEDTAQVVLTVTSLDDDGDGLSSAEEHAIGTDPDDADSDDDGVLDGDEPDYAEDTDSDGAINALDPDSDNDHLFDGTELGITEPHDDTDVSAGYFQPDADPSTTTDPLDRDTDDGGIIDGAEDTNGDGKVDEGELDPNDTADDATVLDSDGDGLPDAFETSYGSNPNDCDTDDDGVIDSHESMATYDTDNDGVINMLDPDSDNDGLFDGTEMGVTAPHADTDVAAGHFSADADPSTKTKVLDRDTDRGGVRDGDEDTNRNGQVDAGERDPLNMLDDKPALPGITEPHDDVDDEEFGVSGGGCNAAGGSASLLAMLALLGMRRRRGVARLVPAAVALLAAQLAAPRSAAAQVAVESRDFAVERFQLAGDRDGLLGVEWAESRGNMAFDLSLWLGYANDPLVVYRMRDGERERAFALVEHRTAAALSASLSPRSWLTVGVELPLVLAQDRDATSIGAMDLGAIASFGIGDLRTFAKLTMLEQARHGISLALAPSVTLPTLSSDDAYLGDRRVALAAQAIASYRMPGWRFALNAGYQTRERTELLDLAVDDELFARAGVGYRFADRGGPRVGLDVTLTGATGVRDPLGRFNQDYLESIAGVTVGVTRSTSVFAAAGVGINEGFGAPDWRTLAGIRVASADQARVVRPARPPIAPAVIAEPPPPAPAPAPVVEEPSAPAKPDPIAAVGAELAAIESIYFALDKAIILERSFATLDHVAGVLAAYPELRVEIQGHTDSQGNDKHNLDLSQRRADAVRDYLVGKGVAAAMLSAVGYGETKPIADNATKEGRAQNRRVVFRLAGADGIDNREQGADASTLEP